MAGKSAIYPYPVTPESIRAYQENEPYPAQQAVFSGLMPSDEAIRDCFEQLKIEDKVKLDFSLAKYKQYIEYRIEQQAKAIVQRGTLLSWSTVRKLVWIRDGGICDVCSKSLTKKQYDCGHIVDRVCGGNDRLDNLVVMCEFCNHELKPPHKTKDEYLKWKYELQGLSVLQ